jgi:hypothetical protein
MSLHQSENFPTLSNSKPRIYKYVFDNASRGILKTTINDTKKESNPILFLVVLK